MTNREYFATCSIEDLAMLLAQFITSLTEKFIGEELPKSFVKMEYMSMLKFLNEEYVEPSKFMN